ncbi:5-oxoprolinase subunit C family protein [Microbacterium gorillae]|uniref:5-oxoprolinase subunit C family protein n=1 Tax=Microbacterium gorillae TaxID=1231063 RepID=UPI000A6AFD1A|nr:biotin-dependent carboxyltransferase family protein [Microbacterium gorillae]
MSLRVLAASPGTTIQDLGRPGLRAIGIAPSGAVDQGALRVANRLVGNPETAAALEITLGGLRVRSDVDAWVCLAGAAVPAWIDDRPVDLWRATLLRAGRELTLGIADHGVRVYLAVAGGIAVAPVLGSRATDTMSGLGPDPVVAGVVLPVGPPAPPPPNDVAPWTTPRGPATVRVRRGPRLDRFAPEAWRVLTGSEWTVSAQADRVGVRLDGPQLSRADTTELPSEGMVIGALQVPPSGRPVILLADGPVTGGYPVIAVVAAADRDVLGQLRPGDRLRLRE